MTLYVRPAGASCSGGRTVGDPALAAPGAVGCGALLSLGVWTKRGGAR